MLFCKNKKYKRLTKLEKELINTFLKKGKEDSKT